MRTRRSAGPGRRAVRRGSSPAAGRTWRPLPRTRRYAGRDVPDGDARTPVPVKGLMYSGRLVPMGDAGDHGTVCGRGLPGAHRWKTDGLGRSRWCVSWHGRVASAEWRVASAEPGRCFVRVAAVADVTRVALSGLPERWFAPGSGPARCASGRVGRGNLGPVGGLGAAARRTAGSQPGGRLGWHGGDDRRLEPGSASVGRCRGLVAPGARVTTLREEERASRALDEARSHCSQGGVRPCRQRR